MSEDSLLRELGRLAKEEKEADKARFDERWDRLAAGTLTAEEDAELRALAESSPEMREIYEAFRPLGTEFQARMVKKIAGELQKDKKSIWTWLLSLFRSTTFRRVGSLTAAAAAAGLFLLAWKPPLPAYFADEPSGGVRTSRGALSSRTFTPGSELELVIHPRDPVTGDVEARAFLARGAEWISWEPRIEIKKGNVRFRGVLSSEMQPGTWRLWAVVSRRGRLPPEDELRSELQAGRTRQRLWQVWQAWQAVPVEVHVANQPPP